MQWLGCIIFHSMWPMCRYILHAVLWSIYFYSWHFSFHVCGSLLAVYNVLRTLLLVVMYLCTFACTYSNVSSYYISMWRSIAMFVNWQSFDTLTLLLMYQRDRFDWWEVPLTVRGEWKSTAAGPGALCVMTVGISMMPMWSADSSITAEPYLHWETPTLVQAVVQSSMTT